MGWLLMTAGADAGAPGVGVLRPCVRVAARRWLEEFCIRMCVVLQAHGA